jgi:hypothetical protein
VEWVRSATGYANINSGAPLIGFVSNVEEISPIEDMEVKVSREERSKGESRHFSNIDSLFDWLDSE